jgi:hypothetical protein
MHARLAVAVLFLVTAMPKVGNAQVYSFGTPPPQVTASRAWWQIQSTPIVFSGLVYRPTGFVRPFDGNVMTQSGVFDGVPVYTDVTLEPFSVLYVPVARGMRQYERDRDADLAGTTGSQTPALPVSPLSAVGASTGTAGGAIAVVTSTRGTSSTSTLRPMSADRSPAHIHMETVPQPRTSDGVWIRYGDVTWYSDGEAVPYTPERFTEVGSYRGFPVYRERAGGNTRRIWVAVVQGGPVAPYVQR